MLWLVCGQTCRDLRKKWFGCANLKTLKMNGELSASFVSCETALSHRRRCLMLTRRYKRTIKSDVGHRRSHRRLHRERAARFPRDDRRPPTCPKLPRRENWSTTPRVTKSPQEIPVYSDAEYEMVEDENTFTEAPWRQEQTGQTFFESEIRRYRLLQNARLSREERQMVLAGTRNDTEYTAIVTKLRSTRPP